MTSSYQCAIIQIVPIEPQTAIGKQKSKGKEKTIMARIPQVTRTVKGAKVTYMAVDIAKETTFTDSIVVSRASSDNAKLLKQLKKLVNTDNVQVVHIISCETIEQKYSMLETEYLKYAKPVTDNITVSDDTIEISTITEG